MAFDAIVIGVSAGGYHALNAILPRLPVTFPPILVVQHIHRHMDDAQIEMLERVCALTVRFAEDKEKIEDGVILFAPANYHLLVEADRTVSLNTDPAVNHARPSVDVLFETAAEVFGSGLIGIILTGASSDGCKGLGRIAEKGGLTIVQDPKTAEMTMMPNSAIAEADVGFVLGLHDIVPFLINQINSTVPSAASSKPQPCQSKIS